MPSARLERHFISVGKGQKRNIIQESMRTCADKHVTGRVFVEMMGYTSELLRSVKPLQLTHTLFTCKPNLAGPALIARAVVDSAADGRWLPVVA